MPNGYIYDQAAMSRSEAILGAEINTDDPVYDQPPLSRIEYLLKTLEERTRKIIRLKDVVPTVDDLPETGNEDGDLYFVGPNDDGEYEEYVYFEEKGAFEKLGSTDIDVSQFVLKAGDIMTGPLKNMDLMYTDDFVGDYVRRVSDDAVVTAAMEAYLANPTAQNKQALITAIGSETAFRMGYHPLGFVNRSSHSTMALPAAVGASLMWGGRADDTNPFFNENSKIRYSFRRLSNGKYTFLLDGVMSAKKVEAFGLKETENGPILEWVPICFRPVIHDSSELPNDPQNGDLCLVVDANGVETGAFYLYVTSIGIWKTNTEFAALYPYTVFVSKQTANVGSASYTVDQIKALDEQQADGVIQGTVVVPKAYVDAKAAMAVSENFETALLSYIDNHIKTQAEYDQLQDKTGFWFIKDPVT